LLKYYYFAFHFILWLLERFLLMTSKYVDWLIEQIFYLRFLYI
jgi:hypothetical protein